MNLHDHDRMLSRLALIAGLCTAAPLFPGVVSAGEPVRSVTVHYGDLNLQTQAGLQTLYARLQAAARQVCPSEGATTLSAGMSSRACRKDALSAAVGDAGIPALAALHESRTGGPAPARVAANGGIVLSQAR